MSVHRLVAATGAHADPFEVFFDERQGVPVILHWGAPLAGVDGEQLARALARPVVPGGLDVEAPLSVVPEHGSGWPGRPGLIGHRRAGTAWAPRFQPAGIDWHSDSSVTVRAHDPHSELDLLTHVDVSHTMRIRCALTNTSAVDRFLLDALTVTLPLPAVASELVTFYGRWTREFHIERRAWPVGGWIAENRAGRTSAEHQPTLFAGCAGFGEWHGDVWGVHLAWSGNHVQLADCLPDGRRLVQVGELLHPGELSLDPGQTYHTPWVEATYSSSGLNAATLRFHRSIRSSPAAPRRQRPVVINTWEAAYFDHQPDRLFALAETAAAAGVERFVLDDGWFGGRRHDRAGLGDWQVSPEVYPNGLGPLIDHVRALGMDFGIWVEPEMVNEDSEMFRNHPDWVLHAAAHPPVLGRHQLVLNLTRGEAFEWILRQLDVLLRDHDISFVKWDMNRNHVAAGPAGGAAVTHHQTLAVYRLIDELRLRHPQVEIESCASGGGRIDFGILQRTSRVWTSDCNDALERQHIQRGASMLIPPEMMGAHIGPTRSHTTGRVHSLSFRAATAMFGHLGIEWDITKISAAELDQLAAVIETYKRFRPLIHGGDAVRFDPVRNGVSESTVVSGVYANDRREALVCVACVATGAAQLPPPVMLPGLVAEARYSVGEVVLPGSPAHFDGTGVVLTGAALAAVGVQLPKLAPESAMLLHVRSIAGDSPTIAEIE